MRELPQTLFDVYALALPRGHGFGDRPPHEAWQTNDGLACGIITRDMNDQTFGIIVLRRREDHVWAVTAEEVGIADLEGARSRAEAAMKEGGSREPIPPSRPRRAPLYDVGDRTVGSVFNLLRQPTHHVAAWLLNQLYLALPNPDRNWAGDCQTDNFHTRMWEAQLLATFREQGVLVTQPHPSPDFHIENRRGDEAWIEAVTANPAIPYDHVGSEPSRPPADPKERVLGAAAVRFAKTLGSKIQRRYDRLPHVAGKPFALALADFHAPSSMVWSREALITYLYGLRAEPIELNGERMAASNVVTHLLGPSAFPAGLFRNGDHAELSAVIFTNACTIGKFNRVGVSAGAAAKGLRYVRFGEFFDRTPGALDGVPFCLDITSDEYKSLWPQGYEPWSAELEVFHNPFAMHPFPQTLLDEATHWFELDGEFLSRSHYETSILWSKTLIQDQDAPIPNLLHQVRA